MTRNPLPRRRLMLVSLVVTLSCWVLAPLAPFRMPGAGAQTGALVFDSFTKSQNFDWTLSGDGRSAGKDSEWGRQEIEFPAPASIPLEGIRFTWTLRATAKVSNLATECEMRGGGLTITANPGTHASAFSPKPGETNTLTVDVFVKPNSVAPGATATLGVSCFSNIGLTFLYRSSAAATTTAAPTTQPTRPATCASGTRPAPAVAVVAGGRLSAMVSAQAVAVDCTVGLTVTSPGTDPTFGRVAPGTTVWLRVTAAAFIPGDRIVVRGRVRDGRTWDVYTCRRASCDFWLKSPKADSYEMQAVHLLGLDGSKVASSDPAYVTWESPTKEITLEWTVPERLREFVSGATPLDQVLPKMWPVDISVWPCPDPNKRGTTYTWTYTDAAGAQVDLNGRITRTSKCKWRVEFDGPGKLTGGATGEGVYPVTVKVTTLADGTFQGTRDVTIEDWLVLGLGDSLASGEGVPMRPSTWSNLQCDRSALSYQALAARKLEQRDEKTSVTFVHLGCSGAAIDDHSPNNTQANGGLLSAYRGINPAGDLPGQVEHAKSIVGTRKVDAVLLSAGVNDAEFGNVAFLCGSPALTENCDIDEFTDSSGREWDPLPTFLQSRFAELPGQYKRLDDSLGSTFAAGYQEGRLPANRVFITEYPNTLQDGRGQLCDGLDVQGLDLFEKATLARFNAAEVAFLSREFLTPLNRAVVATRDLGWRIIPTSEADFGRHGYCAKENWVVTTQESWINQGNVNGAFHPNRTGHREIGTLAYRQISAALRSPA